MYFPTILTILLTVLRVKNTNCEIGEVDLNDVTEKEYAIKINKCCEINEILVDSTCRLAANYNQSVWVPMFKSKDGKDTKFKYFQYVHGMPDCVTTQQRAIFNVGNSGDELNLLVDGRLKHLIHHENSSVIIKDDSLVTNTFANSIHEPIAIPAKKEQSSYTYDQNKYCMDKILIQSTNIIGQYALVCIPEVKINWRETIYLMKAILNLLFPFHEAAP